jgi:hypothetical protein
MAVLLRTKSVLATKHFFLVSEDDRKLMESGVETKLRR